MGIFSKIGDFIDKSSTGSGFNSSFINKLNNADIDALIKDKGKKGNIIKSYRSNSSFREKVKGGLVRQYRQSKITPKGKNYDFDINTMDILHNVLMSELIAMGEKKAQQYIIKVDKIGNNFKLNLNDKKLFEDTILN
jgi:hypothetical protein